VLSSLASVPLTIGYLGTQRFALWMTINSLMTMLTFADLGLGNGLMTAISESHGKDDLPSARRYISTAFFMLLSIGVGVTLILTASYGHVPWARFLGVRADGAVHEAPIAATIFFACFACNLPLAIVRCIQTGYQSGYTTNIWSGVGVVLGFTGVVACAYFKMGVPWLVLSFGVGPLLAILLNGAQLFGSNPELRPTWKEFHWFTLRRLLSVGFGFFIINAALSMAIGSDNFVIAHLLGPNAVTEYSIAMRIFTIVPGLLAMVLMPMWPAYGESVARGDTAWAIRALKRSLIGVGTVTFVAAAVLTFCGKWIITLWVGNRFHEGLWLLSGMGTWMVVNSLAVVVSIFLNGLSRIHVQVVSAVAVAISTLVIELLATPRFGLPAMIWSTDISYLCFVWIPIALFLPPLVRDLQRRSELQRAAVSESSALEANCCAAGPV
jgi:O-antigen/teichoic acid export membrane protein